MTILTSLDYSATMKRFLLIALVVLSVMVSGVASPQDAAATGSPQMTPQVIWQSGFEDPNPLQGMTIGPNPSPSQTPVSAWWGRITYSKRSGSYGLWVAGNNLGNWSTYPAKTSGRATLSLPQLSHFYSSQLGFWYTLPSRGAADTHSFLVGWYEEDLPGTWHTYANFPIRAGWEARAFDLSAPSNKVPLSRKSGVLVFEFDDRVEGSGQSPSTGRGATIDDVAVTGYRYGPVRDLSVTSPAPTTVALNWQKPATSTVSTSADSRVLVYRVWRRAIGTTSWTEAPGSPTSGLSFTDSGVSGGTSYTYLVQPWGTGIDAGFWGQSETGSVAVDVPSDTQHPVTSATVVGDNTPQVTITLSATDNSSGVAATYHRLGLSGSWQSGTSRVITDLGTHTVYYYSVDHAGNEEPLKSVTVTVTPAPEPAINVQGDDRYGTAVAASERAFPDRLDPNGARTVIIATGMNWPDALGGTSLAGVLDGPVLLVKTNSVPAVVLDEIARLRASEAIILGGPGAVGTDVASALVEKAGLTVRRIQGADRYETADKIAREVIAAQGAGYRGRAFVATGGDFPDALAAAPLAAAEGRPLYLAKPKTGLSLATRAAMDGVTHVAILGGTGAVDGSVEGQLSGRQVRRLQGVDRYKTAAEVAKYSVDEGHSWNRVGITTGTNFPDALAGGVLQGKSKSVMLLTQPTKLNPDTSTVLTAKKEQIGTVTYFGGESAVSQAVRAAVSKALK